MSLMSKLRPSPEPDSEMDVIRTRQAKAWEYAAHIERAVADAGFDPNMLMDLSPTYVAAALALGVKE